MARSSDIAGRKALGRHARSARFEQRYAGPIIGGVLFIAFLAAALFPGVLAPYDPNFIDYTVLQKPPSMLHPFGTDNLGRDILSRVIWAASVDLQIAVFSTTFPMIFGTIIGALIGYYGGILDTLFGRLVDLVVTVPFLVLVIAVVAVLGPGLVNLYIAVGMVGWVAYARLTRTEIDPTEGDLRRRGARHGFWATAHHLRPAAAQCHRAGDRLLDDRHVADHPAGLEPRLSGLGRAAAHRRMGRHHRRCQ